MMTSKGVVTTVAVVVVLVTQGGIAALGQSTPQKQSSEEELAEKAIRYLETRYVSSASRSLTAVGLNGLRSVPQDDGVARTMALESQRRVAAALNLPLRTESNPCSLPLGANTYSTRIQSITESDAVVEAESTQTVKGGWGSFVHVLQFERHGGSWKQSKEVKVWHAHGDC